VDDAHVEYFRGIQNPIGVKVGPTTSKEDLVTLLEKLNPDKDPARLVLITRFGASKVDSPCSRSVSVSHFMTD